MTLSMWAIVDKAYGVIRGADDKAISVSQLYIVSEHAPDNDALLEVYRRLRVAHLRELANRLLGLTLLC